MPGIGDGFTPMQVRVALIFLLTLIFTPVVSEYMPPPESDLIMIGLLTLKEFIIGLFLGFIAKLLMTALDVAGMIIANNTSLANASVFNPAAASQGSLPGIFISIAALLLMFATDTHHLFFEAIVQSYVLFDPTMKFEILDFTTGFVKMLSDAMIIGFKIASPMLVIGLLFFTSLGVLARLMPQLQIFFISIPAQILLGFSVFAATVSAGLLLWINIFQDRFTTFLETGGL